jgi:mandelamide amidase
LGLKVKQSRRDFLARSAALSASLVAFGYRANSMPPESSARSLLDLSATEATALMRDGALTAETYANALLKQCETQSLLNAFISLEPAEVLEAAREADKRRVSGADLGPLHGLPIPVKDSVNTVDYPTTGGTPALKNFQPDRDAKLVRLLKDAGAFVMGKTNIHELSFGWTSNNRAFGAVRNPYDTDRIPGGSSGGTAAAIAARMAPLGIAEDTQGSIRVPAALCGICGFRPTTHRYPNEGVMPITPLFDQVGPHARCVDDLQLFDAVMSGENPSQKSMSLRGVRLGVPRAYYYGGLASDVERIMANVLERLADAGAVFVEADVPDLEELIELTTAPVQILDVVPRFSEYLETYGAGLSFDEVLAEASDDIKHVFSEYVMPGGKHSLPQDAFDAARDVHLPALRKALQAYFRDNDIVAMIFPATMLPAPPIGEDAMVDIDGTAVPLDVAVARNISPGSTAGIPGLVLPAALSPAGLPVSLELDGPRGSDQTLLALGHAVEGVLGKLSPPGT